MSTATPVRFEFRCNSCYQTLIGDTDLGGTDIDCQWCGAQVHVPEPTADAIARAENHVPGSEPEGQALDFSDDSQLSKQERKELAAKTARQKMKGGRCKNPSTASAGRFERFAAFIVDRIATVIVILVSFKLASLIWSDVNLATAALGESVVPWAFWMIFFGGPILYALSMWYTIAFYGRTLGKFMLGIKIVDSEGFPPGFFQGVVLRQSIAALNVVTPILPLLALLQWLPLSIVEDSQTAFDLSKLYVGVLALFDAALIALDPPRCLHDRLAGTFVVND